MRRITSRQNPLVVRFRDAARGEIPDVVLLDGIHLLSDALAAGLHVHEAAVAAGALEREDLQPLLRQLARDGVQIVEATSAVMAALSPVRSPSPIVALAERPSSALPDAAGVPLLIVIAVDVQDPGNVGAIVRVAEAGGATSVMVAGSSADPFAWKALRGSMGSALRLPIEVFADATAAVMAARGRGCRILATAPRGGQPLFEVDATGATAIVIGGEGHGLNFAVLAETDELVTIPMEAPVESLNTAVAAALLVYEARRQRSERSQK